MRNKNLATNLIYGLAVAIGLIILIYIGFIKNNVVGYIVYISISIIGGIVALIIKRRTNVWWAWALLWLSAGFAFPIAVICLNSKEGLYSDLKCPICKSDTTLLTAKKGKDVGKQFYVCTRYPECKGRIQIRRKSP